KELGKQLVRLGLEDVVEARAAFALHLGRFDRQQLHDGWPLRDGRYELRVDQVELVDVAALEGRAQEAGDRSGLAECDRVRVYRERFHDVVVPASEEGVALLADDIELDTGRIEVPNSLDGAANDGGV